MSPDQIIQLTRGIFLPPRPMAWAASRWLHCSIADRLLAAEAARSESAAVNPQASKPPHFAPRPRAVFHLHEEAQPNRPVRSEAKAHELHGQKMPESLTKNVPLRVHSKRFGGAAGQPAQVPPLRSMRDGIVRDASARGGCAMTSRWSARCTPRPSTIIRANC